MRLKIHCILIGAIICYCYGCAPKSANIRKQLSVKPPDTVLYENGKQFLEKGQYIKARLALKTMIDTYKDSDLISDARLALADTYYEEGGTENLIQAEEEYKDFIIFFPTNPQADKVQMRIIALNERLMRPPDRDPTYSYTTLKEIEKFEKQFPDSMLITHVRNLKRRVQESLARQDYLIGKYYGDRGNLVAAFSRYEDVTKKYKEYSEMDAIYLQMARILEKAKNPDEAAGYYGKIVQGYSYGKLFDEANARLKALGKEAPVVDKERTEANQSKIKPPEGFNPLRSVTGFFKDIVGSHPDEYAKAIESAKLKAPDITKPSTGSPATSGGLVDIEIKKDDSGNTSTSVTNPDPAAASPDNETDKTAPKPRYPKKNP
jgi:outer membrane protein assembly factor BamD